VAAETKKPRSIWNGWLSWGTVNVPIKLFSALDSKGVSFNQLHGKDGARIKQKRINPRTGEEVPFKEIVRGYEVSPDRWIVVSKEDVAAVEGSRAKVVDIEEFVPVDEIDPVFFGQPYYVGPQDGGEQAYEVVRKALEKSGRVGIGRFVLRNKEQLVALKPLDDVMGLFALRFADELVDPKKVEFEEPKKSPGKREVDMAAKLVDALAGSFEPERYHDTYSEAVMKLIEAKARGETIDLPEPEKREETDDLMAALEASLSGAGKS
jgi:DNA end-binding protein Ku